MINTMNAWRRANLGKDQRYNWLFHSNRFLDANVSNFEAKQNDLLSALETALLAQQRLLDINGTLEAQLQKSRSESNARLQWASQQMKTDALSCTLQHHKGQAWSAATTRRKRAVEESTGLSAKTTGRSREAPDSTSNIKSLRSRRISHKG